MRILVGIIGAAYAVLLSQTAAALADNPFGVMLRPAPDEDMAIMVARARGLGVAWIGPPLIILDRTQQTSARTCTACAVFAGAGLHIALTVQASGGGGAPSHPPEDVDAFKRRLSGILDAWTPDLLVVENEENSAASYQSKGDLPAAYGVELNAACDIAHAKRIACTNGGLTGRSAAALTWLGYLNDGNSAFACDFAKRTLPDSGTLCSYHQTQDVPAQTRAQLIASAAGLLAVYTKSSIDAVNFHWYGADARAFAEIVAYLNRATHKPVLSNEIGQRPGDANPANVRPLLRAAFASGLKLAMWYSIDGANSVSLFEKDGRLRPAGWEFQRQMSGLR